MEFRLSSRNRPDQTASEALAPAPFPLRAVARRGFVLGLFSATFAACRGSWASAPALACDDVESLHPYLRARRVTLRYVDLSPRGETERCTTCRFFEPAGAVDRCGACALVPGPIHPDGWCQEFIARAAREAR